MVEEDKVVVLESVGGVDEDNQSKNPTTNLLDVENVHLQYDNDLVKCDELHLTIITVQAHK
jgi:hypothetical protein